MSATRVKLLPKLRQSLHHHRQARPVLLMALHRAVERIPQVVGLVPQKPIEAEEIRLASTVSLDESDNSDHNSDKCTLPPSRHAELERSQHSAAKVIETEKWLHLGG